jgi:hypothetical protein
MGKTQRLDNDKVFSGFMLGLIAGGVIALFKGPRIRPGNLEETRKTLKSARNAIVDTLETVTPSDPVKDSIAEGKEAARRRRADLGLTDSD